MILYVHGFGSCGAGQKVDVLRRLFGAEQVLSPDLSPWPSQAIEQLQTLIRTRPIQLIVGSSLGGFYAEYLQAEFGVACVLINPSTDPINTLSRYIGPQTHWCTGETYQWTLDHVKQIERLTRNTPKSSERYLVLLQSNDEVLDYRLAETRYASFDVIVENGGNHRFENLQDYAGVLQSFAAANATTST